MPIKNYSTTVRPEKTAAEIVGLLAKKGASTIQQNFGPGGDLTGISFTFPIEGVPLCFQLPVNVEGVAKALMRDRPFTSRSRGSRMKYEARVREESKWVAWRILKDWVEAQIAIIESGQAELAQVFLPYVVDNLGNTLYAGFLEQRKALALTAGD